QMPEKSCPRSCPFFYRTLLKSWQRHNGINHCAALAYPGGIPGNSAMAVRACLGWHTLSPPWRDLSTNRHTSVSRQSHLTNSQVSAVPRPVTWNLSKVTL